MSFWIHSKMTVECHWSRSGLDHKLFLGLYLGSPANELDNATPLHAISS